MKKILIVNSLVLLLIASVLGSSTIALAQQDVVNNTSKPYIQVYLPNGKLLNNSPVSEYDQLIVRGYNFKFTNTNGLPVPIPNGVPHGVFVSFGFFQKNWRPSQQAPNNSRSINRSSTKWVITRESLDKVPSFPFNFRNTIKSQAVYLQKNGTFTARLTVKKPAKIPANSQAGIVTYGADEAIAKSQELFVPVNFSNKKGKNDPSNLPRDLIMTLLPKFSSFTKNKIVGGSVSAAQNSYILPDKRVTFAFQNFDKVNKIIKFKGIIKFSARYHLYDTVFKDPWIHLAGSKGYITAEVSKSFDSSTNEVVRTKLALIKDIGSPYLTINNWKRWDNLEISWLKNTNFPFWELNFSSNPLAPENRISFQIP